MLRVASSCTFDALFKSFDGSDDQTFVFTTTIDGKGITASCVGTKMVNIEIVESFYHTLIDCVKYAVDLGFLHFFHLAHGEPAEALRGVPT